MQSFSSLFSRVRRIITFIFISILSMASPYRLCGNRCLYKAIDYKERVNVYPMNQEQRNSFKLKIIQFINKIEYEEPPAHLKQILQYIRDDIITLFYFEDNCCNEREYRLFGKFKKLNIQHSCARYQQNESAIKLFLFDVSLKISKEQVEKDSIGFN